MKQPGQLGRDDLTGRIARGARAEVYRANTVGIMGFLKDVAVELILPETPSHNVTYDIPGVFADASQDALVNFLPTQTTQTSRHTTRRWMVERSAPSILAEQRTQMADALAFASYRQRRAQPRPPHPLARGRPAAKANC